ncbi:MAG TPA: pyridoxamine 5'-phosphate oxidase family protein [Burkholderiales bacterium]|nr:pyridoxamine 5'-phosphate oxidase family protein [Burkholderiales bacterium]
MREKALSYLAAHNVMTLATKSVWAAAVFYASEGFDLYFVSSPRSRHARDLAEDPRVAAAIHEDYRDWRAIRGIQLSGTAERLGGAARAAALACYRQKFPFLEIETTLLEVLGKIACYRVMPTEMHFLDNNLGFGARARVHLSR